MLQPRSSIGAEPADLSATSRSGSGDGLAARIGRFLIGPMHVASGQLHAVAAHDPGGGGATPAGLAAPPTGVSGAGSAGHTFGQILAAGADPTDATDAMDGTARLLHAAGGQGRYQASLQLDPPELGQLRVQIRMHHQAMTLRVDADNAAAGRLIGMHMGDLRDALAIHGIRVDRADVVVRSESPGQAGTHTQYGEGSTGGHDNPSGSATSDWHDGGGRTDAGSQDERRSGDRSADRPESVEQPARLAAEPRTVERVSHGMTSAAELSLDLVA
ncbi:MAG: flagellar hook-length control protein FliK [Phycisphaerae bacterium]